MVPLTEILDHVTAYHTNADIDLINRAYVYSARMHDGQTRRSGEPYFVHPVSVADIITQLRLDTASVCAALLHDVIEDTSAGEDEIVQQFGKEVAFLVGGVTKLGKMHFGSREDRQAENFRKMLVAMARDIRVLLVKLADRLDNMRTLHHMPVDAQERIARETMEIYAPLAGRLGIQWLKDELEDLSFKYLYPEAYAEVCRKLDKLTKDSDKYIERVGRELSALLREAGFEAHVSGRIKHPYSVYRKMRENQVEFERVHDLLAFRAVTEKTADCYAALGIIHSHWTPIPGRFKDYIALPKSNMYQSLHTAVIGPGRKRVEIQIRTKDMHRTADMGIAAHWNYKEPGPELSPKDAARFSWLRQLMEYQKEVADPDEFIDGVKVDLFNDEVYVFTPKGDVRVFPRGSTPIDFAYSIHTEVGDHCTGARVNGSIVPLRYKLHNGDTVEILTTNKQRPSKDWLEFVATARARSRVRAYIRSEERSRSIKLGRELMERELRKRGLSFARFQKKGNPAKIGERFRVGSEEDLFARIGYGKIAASQVIDVACPPENPEAAQSLRPSLLEKTVKKVTRRSDTDGIVINDMTDVLVRFAKCCNPVPGDPVTGWITRGRGVTVHRRGCSRAMELDRERRVAVSWSNKSFVTRPVSLRVVTADRSGILSQVSSVFTAAGVNILEANCRTQPDGQALNTFLFSVGDVSKLRALMRNISKIDGVYDVTRG